MSQRKGKSEPSSAVLEPQVTERLNLLESFADLVAERFGYLAGRKIKTSEMNEKIKDQLDKAKESAKAASKAVETLVKEPSASNAKVVVTARETLKSDRDSVKAARKPFLSAITPLTKAIKYMDSVVLPDSLTELGKPIKERFSLSKHVSDALEASKKK